MIFRPSASVALELPLYRLEPALMLLQWRGLIRHIVSFLVVHSKLSCRFDVVRMSMSLRSSHVCRSRCGSIKGHDGQSPSPPVVLLLITCDFCRCHEAQSLKVVGELLNSCGRGSPGIVVSLKAEYFLSRVEYFAAYVFCLYEIQNLEIGSVPWKVQCFPQWIECSKGGAGWVDSFGGIRRSGVLVQYELSDPILNERIQGAEAANWSIVLRGTHTGLVPSGAAGLSITYSGPVAAPFHRWLSADEAKLHPTGASDVIAAIVKLDFPFALLKGTQLEVFASCEALESCIVGVGGAH